MFFQYTTVVLFPVARFKNWEIYRSVPVHFIHGTSASILSDS